MNEILDLDKFQTTNAIRGRRWHQGDLTQWSLLEWAGAMCGEAGEAANAAKKLRRLDLELPNKEAGIPKADMDALREKLADEVGDTIIYGLLILSVLYVSASQVIARVFDRKSIEYGFPERALPVIDIPVIPAEPIDKHTMGLYEKFKVWRTDGTSATGAKHDGCQYFVLDVTHDPHALAALRAYAASCETFYPKLASDLRDMVEMREGR